MKYVSTRGQAKPLGFSDIALEGLASDGGLTLPREVPRFSDLDLRHMRKAGYGYLAERVMAPFVDLEGGKLTELIARTYTPETFGDRDITPVTQLHGRGMGGCYLLNLSRGPTLSFKDIALQFLGNLFQYLLEQRGDYLNLVGATSGDTGSAAIHGVLGKGRIGCFILSPLEGMSEFQAAQMRTVLDHNVHNLAVRGVFDDCQDLVKELNSDGEFKKRRRIGAVNSINWGRVLAQMVYYAKAYSAIAEPGEEVDFAVPTGNFGDIFAGWMVRKMGLPIRRLVLATNENDVLDRFFRTGVYKPGKTSDVAKTSSPSMDISRASNLERLLYYVLGERGGSTWKHMMDLQTVGQIDLRNTPYLQELQGCGIVSGVSTHKDRIRTIKEVQQKTGFVIDPHTADGVKVGLDYKEGRKMVFLATASPVKFEPTIREALGWVVPRPKKFEGLEARQQGFTTIDRGDLQGLKDYVEENAIRVY